MKGGYLALRSSALLALGGVESAPVDGTGARLGAALGYRKVWGPWWALGTVRGGTAAYPGVALDVDERRLGAGLSAGYRWLAWPVVPHVGASLELTFVEQRFERDAEDQIQDTFGVGSLPERRALGIAGGVVAGVEIPISGRVFGLAQGQLLVGAFPSVDGGSSVEPAAAASIGMGWRL
jgi:hypothetical protein